MSGIVGAQATIAKLQSLGGYLPARLREAHETAAKEMQDVAVQLVPKRTGKTAALLASADAVGPLETAGKKRGKAASGETEDADKATFVAFGFRTKELQRAGYKALWLEFGNKAYAAGDNRRAGKDKKGKQRFSKVKRAIPARPARPFMRPAAILMRKRLQELRSLAYGRATIDMASGGEGLVASLLTGGGAESTEE